MPHRVSHPDDVPMCAGLAQRVLRLGDAAAEWASRRTPGYWCGFISCMPSMMVSWAARASGKTCAMLGSGVDATGWRA